MGGQWLLGTLRPAGHPTARFNGIYRPVRRCAERSDGDDAALSGGDEPVAPLEHRGWPVLQNQDGVPPGTPKPHSSQWDWRKLVADLE